MCTYRKWCQFRNNTGPPRPMFNPISRCCSSVVKVCLNACARLALMYFRVGSRFVQIWFRCGSSLCHLFLVEVWVKRGFRIGPSNHTVLSKLNKPLPKLRVPRRRVKPTRTNKHGLLWIVAWRLSLRIRPCKKVCLSRGPTRALSMRLAP